MARLWCDTRCLVPNRLLKKPGNGPKRHTGRDEVEIRYPVNYCSFWIPDIRLGGFRNDESRLPARHHARHASKARRAGREPLRRGGRGKPLPQILISLEWWSFGVLAS